MMIIIIILIKCLCIWVQLNYINKFIKKSKGKWKKKTILKESSRILLQGLEKRYNKDKQKINPCRYFLEKEVIKLYVASLLFSSFPFSTVCCALTCMCSFHCLIS
jgi:hypothetical protein